MFDFSNQRLVQKTKYGGEMFVADSAAVPDGATFIDFFQLDRDGDAKGIIAINLGGVA